MKKSIFLASLLFCSILLNAQWQKTNGPFGGNITSVITKGEDIFAATADHGVYRSSDNGNHWMACNNGLVSTNINAIATDGVKIYAGGSGGIFLSQDNGNTWSTVFINGTTYQWITALAVNQQNIYAGTYYGTLFKSNNNGLTWDTAISQTTGITTIAINGQKIFVGTKDEYFYRSLDNGVTFERRPFYGRPIQSSFAFIGSKVYVAAFGYVYYSVDDGDNWTDIFNGINIPAVFSLANDGSKLYAGCSSYGNSDSTYNGGLFTFDEGTNLWSYIGMTNYSITSFYFNGSRILAGTSPGGIFASDDAGSHWTESANGLVSLEVKAMTSNGPAFLALTNEEGMFKSQDNGKSWKHANNGYMSLNWGSGYSGNAAFALNSSKLFVGGGSEVLVSVNDAESWQLLFTQANSVTSLLLSGTDLFVATLGGGIFKTPDEGVTWMSVNNGLANPAVQSLITKGTDIYAGTEGGVFVSSDHGVSWTAVNNGLIASQIIAMAANSQYLFASGGSIFASQTGIFRSKDNGANWSITGPGLEINSYASSLVIDKENIIAGMSYSEGQVCFSDDNGTTWSVVNSGLPLYSGIRTMTIMDSTLYASVSDLTTNQGNLGVWNRPLSELIAFRTRPDTIILQQYAGDMKTISVTSSTPWSLGSNLPAWLSASKTEGQGTDNIVFSTTQLNPYDGPRLASLDMVSAGISRHLTVVQSGKIIGINEHKGQSFLVYPNPSSGIFNLESNIPFEEVTVYNSLGKVIVDQRVTNPKIKIDLSSEGRGIYWVKVSGKAANIFRKVVVL